ncbi:acetylcholinesterase [Podospora fimiseda]|uniref:Carboxylic ester hydrolase n=1 Tax=Podospora fimiseda TaxID=252190 RepID=A0AAN7BJ77_9PEZI|nr:acetylcholinesterase [Podospora fimiseda]
MRIHHLFLSFLFSSFSVAAPGPKPPNLTVKTTSGKYTGFINSTAPDVRQWLGIPYAQPPLGSLRFMPPKKAPNYGVADAKAYKPICYQNSGPKTSLYWKLLPEYLNRDSESEDCLYLNIWAPKNPVEKKVPVIIWVSGGGYKEGGGHALYQVPDQWIQRMQTHIVVTFNFRLHIFGFPGSPAASINAGLLDLRLAVEWLKDNIKNFGGDPNRMILYGQSSGNDMILRYSYAHPKNPIVKGFIGTSGGTPVINPTSSPNFHNAAQVVGCANLTATEELICMQNVDPSLLQNAVDVINPDPNRGLFRPIADNITTFTNLTERLEKGLVAKLPYIGGFMYNEGAVFLPFDPDATTAPTPVPVPGLEGLWCAIKQEVDKRVAHGLPAYRYIYSGNFSNVTPRYWLGGMHSSDIPLIFGTHNQVRGNSTQFQFETSFEMQEFWVSFAQNPDKPPRNSFNQIWPKYSLSNPRVMEFGNLTIGNPSHVAPVSVADWWSGPCLS